MADEENTSRFRPASVRWKDNNTRGVHSCARTKKNGGNGDRSTGTPLRKLNSLAIYMKCSSKRPMYNDFLIQPFRSSTAGVHVGRNLRRRSVAACESVLRTSPESPIERSNCLHGLSLDTLKNMTYDRNRPLSPYFCL